MNLVSWKRKCVAAAACLSIGSIFSVNITPSFAQFAPLDSNVSHESCSLSTLKGAYGVYGEGSVLVGTPQAAPQADIGVLTFDGKGGVSGATILNSSGKIIRTNVSGSYTVNPDCTTRLTVKTDTGEMQEEGIILERGREIRFIGTDPGAVVTRVGRRMEHR